MGTMTTGQVIKLNKAIISKQSLRELTKRSRLPASFQIYLAGGGLLELLTANSLEKKFRLWHMSYWASVRQLNRNQMILTWKPI
jgi:hypothetical protein